MCFRAYISSNVILLHLYEMLSVLWESTEADEQENDYQVQGISCLLLNLSSYILIPEWASLVHLHGLQFVADTPINSNNRKGVAWKPGFEALPRSCP